MMHYPRAPIKEAIIDIRAKMPSLTEDDMASVQALIRERYPGKREHRLAKAKIQFGGGEGKGDITDY